MQSSDEWEQNYQEMIGNLSFDDATDFAAALTGDDESSPRVSSGKSLSPVGKPIRKRSRASKKTPTTLLTVNADNFRALVQQFTGCHSAHPSIGAYKGPINLNFERYNYLGSPKPHEDHNQQQHDQSLVSFGSTNEINRHDQLFVSSVDHNTRLDSLTLDDFDVENYSMQRGDYTTALPGTRLF